MRRCLSPTCSYTHLQLPLPACPMSTVQGSQPAARATNRSHLVASRVKAFPGRQTNSDSTQHRTAHLDGAVIRCHQRITSHTGSVTASLDVRPTPLALFRLHTIHQRHPCPHQNHQSHDYHTHAPTVTNSSAFHEQL